MVQLNMACVENCPFGYITTHGNVCIKFDPNAEKEKPDLTWLWIMLGIIGCVVIGCVVALVVAAMKKRKIDMLLGLNVEEIDMFENEFSE